MGINVFREAFRYLQLFLQNRLKTELPVDRPVRSAVTVVFHWQEL